MTVWFFCLHFQELDAGRFQHVRNVADRRQRPVIRVGFERHDAVRTLVANEYVAPGRIEVEITRRRTLGRDEAGHAQPSGGLVQGECSDAVVPAVAAVDKPAVGVNANVGAGVPSLEVVRERGNRMDLADLAGIRVKIQRHDARDTLENDESVRQLRMKHGMPRRRPRRRRDICRLRQRA